MTLKLVGPNGSSYTDWEEAHGRPMSPSEIAELETQLAEQKRLAVAQVATTEIKITFEPIENDPSKLATVEVDMPYPISMGFSGIVVRRCTAEERVSLGPGELAVRLVFGRPETPEDEQLERALTPKILRAWERYEKARARERMRTIK